MFVGLLGALAPFVVFGTLDFISSPMRIHSPSSTRAAR